MAAHDNVSVTGGGESLPLPNNLHSSSDSGPGSRPSFLGMANGLKKRFRRDSASDSSPATTAATPRDMQWWKVHLFRGMINDIRRRAPYYCSDWKDAWDYRVVPATIYMYFAKYGLSSSHWYFVPIPSDRTTPHICLSILISTINRTSHLPDHLIHTAYRVAMIPSPLAQHVHPFRN